MTCPGNLVRSTSQSWVKNIWAYEQHIEHIFTHPDRPMQNGYIEGCDGKLRDECLNQHWIRSVSEAIKVPVGI